MEVRPKTESLGRLDVLLLPIALMWIVEIADSVLPLTLDAYGIRPRSLHGLIGIPCSPFLHGGFQHLMANTVPLLVLGGLIALKSVREFLAVTINIVLLSGLGTWMIGGENEIHIGASGLVFGEFGFLVMRGYFERRLPSLMISGLVVVLYGGMMWGVLPTQPGVSWEGHLCGFLAGAVVAAARSRANAFTAPL